MTHLQKRIIEVIALFFSLIVIFSFLKESNLAYPYYLSWDMDLTTTIDLLITQSQRLHVHFAHPGTGMYMILKPIHFIGYQLGFVDSLSLSDLSVAHNPSLVVAQLTAYLRAVSPYIVTAICIFLCLTVILISQSSIFLRMLALLLIFSGYWVSQQATFIRTETYAWLFLSLSCLSSALAARSQLLFKKKLMLFLLGLFLGLAYYTKIQSLPSLILPIVIYFIYNETELPIESHFYKRISGAALFVFIFLIVASLFYGFPPDTYIEHFRDKVTVTKQGLLLFFSFSFLFVICFRPVAWSSKFYFCTLVALGFVASFLLPLLQYSSISKGIELTLVNFQSVVMTKIYSGLSLQIAPTLDKVISVFSESHPILVPVLISYFLVLLSYRKDSTKLRFKLGLSVLLGLVLFNLCFVVRDASRHDIVWYEPIAHLIIIFALGFLWNYKLRFKWSGVVIVTYLVTINLINISLAYNNSQFSYGNERAFLKQSYPGQRDYTLIFTNYLQGLDVDAERRLSSELLLQAREHKNIDFFLRFHFTNLKSDIRWISRAQNGWKVLDGNWKVTQVSNSINGQNLLDLRQAVNNTPKPSRLRNFFSHLLIEPEFAKKWIDPRVRILARIQDDTSSYLLLDPTQNKSISCTPASKENWLILKNSDQSSIRLESYYCGNVIPFEALKGPVLVAMIYNNP